MNQNTKTPESREKSKLSGQGSDTLNLPSTSREIELNIAAQGHGTETNNMKQLLNEFKGLYEERLRRLELETTGTEEDIQRMKVCVLQSYVNDLADQNQVLVQTIEDLEKENDHKVSNLGMKLRTSDGIIDDLNQQRRTLEQSVCALCSKNTDLKSDLSCLTQLIQRTGHIHNLDVSGVELKTLLLDEIVGPVAHIPQMPGSLVQMRAELEDLKIQLSTKDLVISGLERELTENLQQNKEVLGGSEELAYLQSELSCLQRIQRDGMKATAEKDVSVTQLHAHIQLLQQEGADARAQLSKLNERVRELQEEVSRKEEEWRAAEEERRQREDKRRQRDERERRKAEERSGQEQRKREEEWVKRVEEEKGREEEWKRGSEEEREAHAQAIKKWAEKAAILNSELEASRKQVERQRRELSELHQKEETLLSELQRQERRLCEGLKAVRIREEETAQLHRQLEDNRRAHTLATQQAEAKTLSLRSELSASFERRMVEKVERINRLTEELNGVREQVGDLQQKLWGQSKELDEAQQCYQDSMEDNARLRARLDTHTLSARSLTSELSSAVGRLHALEKQLQDKQKELESAAHKIVCLESSLKEAEESCVGAKTEVQNHSLLLEEMARELERLSVAEKDATLQVKEREKRVRHLDQDAVALRTTQDSLKRTLAMKEKHTQQLVQDNSQLKDSLAALQSNLQTSECMVSDISETLDQVKTSLNQERQQSQQIQDQLHHANQEVERLQQDLTHVRRAAEKKIQKREVKMCALLKELTESKKQHSDCQKGLLSRESVLERLREERDELRAKMEERSRECVGLSQTKERLETDLALSHEKHHNAHLEVRSRDQLILQLRAEMKTAEQKHQGTQEEMSALEAEVRRLNRKVRGHQEEACQLREQVRDREGLRDQTEKERQQLHNQLSISQQQVKSQAESIDRLNSDLEAVKQAHKSDAERWSQRNFLLHSQLEQTNSELSQTQDRLKERESEVMELKESLSRAEAGQHEAAEKVEASEGLIKKQEAEMELLCQRLTGAQEDLREASTQAQDQKETLAIFKQKYTAAMEKVHRVQGQVESLEEELRYSQQQLRESQVATHSVKAELAELEGQYQEKVGQWESSQEALDQLTDELQANQNLLRESRQKVGQCEGLMATLQEQVDILKQQKLLFESDLRLHQQTHSHSDEEFVSLLKHRQQLQKRCTEQVERLAACERTILQMKTELERQSQEKAGLERSLVASQHTHLSNRGQLEQEVTRLEQEVTRLELELANTHRDIAQRARIRDALLRQSEEDLKEAGREAARRSREVEVQREQVQRLQEELQREEEETRSALRENQSLSGHITQLSQEMEELRSKHQLAVEELAARAEEARRMAGCLNEGKLAEEKIRSAVGRMEREVTELRKAQQQAVDQRLQAEREKQDAQEQVDRLRLEVEGMRSDNANLRHESQLVMTNVNRWITEQKVSSESLAAQIKAQNKVLAIITEEKEHLQEANDTLKEEVKKLKKVAEEKQREMERFKAQMQDHGAQQEERFKERESCVALNLSKIEDMQTRLQSNLEAIGMLNQQLSALGGENERLRRQLEEERSVRRQVERLLPPPPPPPPPPTHQRCSSVQLPLSLAARPPPLTASPPSSLRLPYPLSPDPATGDGDRMLTRAELSGAGPERPGESQAVGEAHRRRPAAERSVSAAERSVSAALEDVWSGRTRRDHTK